MKQNIFILAQCQLYRTDPFQIVKYCKSFNNLAHEMFVPEQSLIWLLHLHAEEQGRIFSFERFFNLKENGPKFAHVIF